MFTGLVESKGIFSDLRVEGSTHRFVIRCQKVATDVEIGDSICVSGCCLTVVEIDGDAMAFEAGEETMSRTNLGRRKVGDEVNLERSLAVGDRLGGHYVTGHVDTVGTLIERRDDPPWAHLKFSIDRRYASQVASKGSVAIDGISLTVVEAGPDWFTVALIPHTLDVTTMGGRAEGDAVNLETDVLAKYVERCLAHAPAGVTIDSSSGSLPTEPLE